MSEKYPIPEEQDLPFGKPEKKLPEDNNERSGWLENEIVKYIDNRGFFQLPSEDDSRKLSKEGKGYCEEEVKKLISGISEQSGVEIGKIEDFIKKDGIDIKKLALRLLRQKRRTERISEYSAPVDIPEEPKYLKEERKKTTKKIEDYEKADYIHRKKLGNDY